MSPVVVRLRVSFVVVLCTVRCLLGRLRSERSPLLKVGAVILLLAKSMVVLVLARQWVPAARRLVAVNGQGMRMDGMLSVVTLVTEEVLVCESMRLVVVRMLFTPLTQSLRR